MSVQKARELVERAHAGQLDKAGQPYVGHLERVASYVDQGNPLAIAAALLHDSIEDTELTAKDLAAQGIPLSVVEVVELLTRRSGQASDAYYRAIRDHPLAREVKLADLADNTDPDRLARLPATTRDRLTGKYATAYRALAADPADGAAWRAQAGRVPR